MDELMKTGVWQQFGAALDMLYDAIIPCPDSLWAAVLWEDEEDARYGQFWFIAYHTLAWTHRFLNGTLEGFTPPPPFIRGALPETPYTKDDILAYLRYCRERSKTEIGALTDETAYRVCIFEWMEPTYLELQLYSMRHIQEHGAQLHYFLGRHGIASQDWVAKARDLTP